MENGNGEHADKGWDNYAERVLRNEVRLDALEELVQAWRAADHRALVIARKELARRLDVLNHANRRQVDFQNNSVTRELFASEQRAQATREEVLRNQIIALDRALLAMAPQTMVNDKFADVTKRIDELKTYVDTTQGRAGGYSALYGWIAAAVVTLASIITTAVILANYLSAK